jgi:hypothetical protein
MATSTHHDLLDACKKPGCPVCRLEQRSLERYLDGFFFESVNDIKLREQLRGSMGFCKEHTRLAMNKRQGNALGFAIIYNDVITNILKGFNTDTPPSTSSRLPAILKQVPEQVSARVRNVLYALTPHKHCIVCTQQDRTVHTILATLVEGLDGSEMTRALRTSDGLCVPHLKKAFDSVHTPAECDELLSIHREKLESLRAELAEFIRKNDYRHRKEGFGSESDSWLRASRMLTGNRGEAQD